MTGKSENAGDLSDRPTGSSTPLEKAKQKSVKLGLLTPQSCSSYTLVLTPGTPDPVRGDLKLLTGRASVIFFDFDGTLTATPGNMVVQKCSKSDELRDRATLLAPRLAALQQAGIVLGIISKSTELTIRSALQASGLSDFFSGPIVGKAVGFEGKAGFIAELALTGSLASLLDGEQTNFGHILLVDDDVRELDRAQAKGMQTFPAPADGGLQAEDFDEIFAGLGIFNAREADHPPRTPSPRRFAATALCST